MEKQYYTVKPKKRIYLFAGCLALSPLLLAVFIQSWYPCILAALASLILFFLLKNDRILYNEQEVILFSYFGNTYRLSWYQIDSVVILNQVELGRGSYSTTCNLIISYSFYVGVEKHLNTKKKPYRNYRGAFDFVEFYKKIKKTDD